MEKRSSMAQSAKHVSIIISFKIFNELLNHTLLASLGLRQSIRNSKYLFYFEAINI